MYKLAVIGTHGIGKTTLCQSLASRLQRVQEGLVTLGPEDIRECPYPTQEKMTYEASEWYVSSKVWYERWSEREGFKYMVCDRSAYDTIPYLETLGRESMKENAAISYALKLFAEEYLFTYDLLVFVRPSQEEVAPDGFRMTDKKIQLEIDANFATYFEDFAEWSQERTRYIPMLGRCEVMQVESKRIFEDQEVLVQEIMEKVKK